MGCSIRVNRPLREAARSPTAYYDNNHVNAEEGNVQSAHVEAKAKPLGTPLRLVQAYYALVLLIGLLYGAFINPEVDISFVYDLSMIRAIVQMCTSAQAIWLIERRSSGAAKFCIISTLACIVLSAVDVFFMGANTLVFNRLGQFATYAFVGVEYVAAGAVVAYLATSEHVRDVLDVPLDLEPEGPGNSWEEMRYRERIRTWPFWRNTIMYFIVFSFLGHWAEILFCRLILAGVFMGGYDPTNIMLWDQWLFPFSAEGTALAMVVLFLHPLKQRIYHRTGGNTLLTLLLSFLANAAVCTSIDFLTGMVANQNYELWDYRDMPFNFMGQVCLQNSMVYSIAATLIVWVFYPLMDRGLRKMPRSMADALFFGLVGLYAFEAALHFLNF